jgi:hypothetical protein
MHLVLFLSKLGYDKIHLIIIDYAEKDFLIKLDLLLLLFNLTKSY